MLCPTSTSHSPSLITLQIDCELYTSQSHYLLTRKIFFSSYYLVCKQKVCTRRKIQLYRLVGSHHRLAAKLSIQKHDSEPKPGVPSGCLQPLLSLGNFIIRKGDSSQQYGHRYVLHIDDTQLPLQYKTVPGRLLQCRMTCPVTVFTWAVIIIYCNFHVLITYWNSSINLNCVCRYICISIYRYSIRTHIFIFIYISYLLKN